MLKGFLSNRIGQSKLAETPQSAMRQNYNNVGLVGFASKGPINTPTIIRNNRQLRKVFGLPHPDQKESNLLYAAEQCLLVDAEVLVYRAADKTAETATVPIPGIDDLIITHSTQYEPYVFSTNQFFRWKLNGITSNKTLVVLATDQMGINATQLAEELNDQLSPKDSIQFYVYEKKYLAVRTTPKSKLELVSIQNVAYGPWDSAGFKSSIKPAEKIGQSETGLYDLELEYDLTIDLILSGSGDNAIDGIIQTIKLNGLENKINKISDIVDYINNFELPFLPGGWRAFVAGNALGFRTKRTGKSISIVIKPTRASTKIFLFDTVPTFGESPKDAIFFDSRSHNDNISMTIHADSPGEDGNNTKVIISNDYDSDTFTIDVFHNGLQVESWGQLTKKKESRFYVESFINLVSEWIKVVDNINNLFSPKNGTYLLGDERITNAVKGCDGIPADLADQDRLLAGDSNDNTGVYALVDIDMVTVPGHSSDIVIKTLIDVCNSKNCLAIIDPPMGLSAKATSSWIKPYQSDFAAIFWPWVQIHDSYNRRNVWVPPSGSVMAAIVRSDAIFAPWHASKGITPGVLSVFNRPTHEETNLLNESNINQIVHLASSDSFVVNYKKTLGNGNINTRRTLFYVEKRIHKDIDKLIGYNFSQDELRKKIFKVCEYVLGQVKSGRGIHDYTIQMNDEIDATEVDKKEFCAKIGIQPRENSMIYNIDIQWNNEKADTFQFDKGDR